MALHLRWTPIKTRKRAQARAGGTLFIVKKRRAGWEGHMDSPQLQFNTFLTGFSNQTEAKIALETLYLLKGGTI